ncbi:hypothetical protein BLNAU_11076 [Blattamonas nauphoetae]|uniref:Uncharacterized protein n=1 Tax=Blattamonas nauphoetae TaxID=2049346 RepID=A0ABQ9XQF4_9EUKA|nr:hypothetical protein BLNAU_11076 [Blattamonas nauphoetae]
MEILKQRIWNSSEKVRLAFVTADLIPQLINNLNPLSISFVEAADINFCLLTVISHSVWLATPNGLTELKIYKQDEQRAVHETVSKQVLAPSEKYISHLCANRFSIVDGQQSKYFLELLARLLRISTSYHPTMEFVLRMPVILTIPSCLSFFEENHSIWSFLFDINNAQQEWNQTRGIQRQMWKTLHRLLRMEGIEDVIEQKLQNNRNGLRGGWIVANSIIWNNLLVRILTRQSPSVVPTLSIFRLHSRPTLFWKTMRRSMDGVDSCSVATHTLPLPSASPSPPHPPTRIAHSKREEKGKTAS